MNRAIPGKEMIGWHALVIHDPNGTWPPNLTNTWDELGAQLAGRQKDLNDFRKLIENPRFDFNYDYSDSKMYIPALAPHLSQIKLAIQWLEASEFYNLHQENTAEACTDVRAMLAFVKGQTDERFEISQLIRFAIAQMIAGATWDVLQTTNVTDEELAQLQHDWRSLEFVRPLENAFSFERVASLALQNNLRHSPAAIVNYARLPTTSFIPKSKINGKLTDWNGSSTNFVLIDEKSLSEVQRPTFVKATDVISRLWHCLVLWPQFESYNDELQGLREWQVIFTATHMAETNVSFLKIQSFVNTNVSELGLNQIKENPYAIFSRNADQLPALRKAAGAEVARNIVITAIALKRYEIRHHRLPDKLHEMVPNLLEFVPIDCMDGQPLRYRRNADGTFLLYSVGENGNDDGGNGSWDPSIHLVGYSWQYYHALDWVWPQPATEEEIQKYYAQQNNSR
jgi:hypothetical protein